MYDVIPPNIPSKNIDIILICVNIIKLGEYTKLNKNPIQTPAQRIQVTNLPNNFGSILFT